MYTTLENIKHYQFNEIYDTKIYDTEIYDNVCNHNKLFCKKYLIIPDLVIEEDIPKILDWFYYYNVANIKHIQFNNHLEEEYYIEDYPFYGYATIEIDTWYCNSFSKTFYNELICNIAKIN